jgi:carboxyl-terminal processing protease
LSSEVEESHYSINRCADNRTPILILTDSSSASASEIVAAALRDNKRAVIAGSRTLGKNVAQAIMVLSSGCGVAFTIRSYVSPTGKSMENGVEPDLILQEHDFSINDIRFEKKTNTWWIGTKHSVSANKS